MSPAGAARADHGPHKFCDLIMKGGITSGVVYPLAIVELSDRYRFKNIGGASAGAIAAATAAAAEHGRDRGGFRKLEKISEEIGPKLLELFQPAPAMKPVFNAFLGAMAQESKLGKLAAVLWALFSGYWAWSLLGLVPGGIYLWFRRGSIAWESVVVVLLLWALGLSAALAFRLRRLAKEDLKENDYGICSGLNNGGSEEALTEWLTRKLDDLAGKDTRAKDYHPLTFGDLWGDDPKDPDETEGPLNRTGPEDAAIRLVIMTTNLSSSRPLRMPFEKNLFQYDPKELARIFPPKVLKAMEEKSSWFDESQKLRWLPLGRHLPVVVAVRMSLSFPILLSAVRLHSRDFTLPDRKKVDAKELHPDDPADPLQFKDQPLPTWFSDGGLSSNFPIHFFDSLWPRRPTFGITLDKYDTWRHDGRNPRSGRTGSEKETRVWLPNKARKGILTEFREIETVTAFLGSIVGAMKDWHDKLQTVLPGYRERVVHVRLTEQEGGLNLNMESGLITTLSGYGRSAGKMLKEDFDMDAHRWRRYVVSMAKLEEVLEQELEAYSDDPVEGEGYGTFFRRYAAQPAEYKQEPAWLTGAEINTAATLKVADEWLRDHPLRGGEIPRPESDFRIGPRV